MKAIFEIELNPEDLIDKGSLKTEYQNSYFICLKSLLEDHALTIYDLSNNELKLIEVREND